MGNLTVVPYLTLCFLRFQLPVDCNLETDDPPPYVLSEEQ